MQPGVWTVGCLLWLAFGICGCALIAMGKERSPIIWGFLGFWFGLIAMVVVALLPHKRPRGGIAQPDPLSTGGVADSRAMLTARHAQRPTTTLPATSSLRTRLAGKARNQDRALESVGGLPSAGLLA